MTPDAVRATAREDRDGIRVDLVLAEGTVGGER